MKKLVLLLTVLVLLVGCGDVDALPAPDSDSAQSYKSGSKIPVDDDIYTITGKVTADVNSITRQGSGGSLSAYDGYMSGSFWSETTGKGFVRLFVHTATPATNLAPPERLIILKTTDSKVTALYPGDIVTFKCRRQYEALAAVRENETFNAGRVETWELDYCRLVNPVVEQGREN